MTETSQAPARPASKLPPKRLYAVLAGAEMVTWALLILGMVLKYSGTSEAFVPVFGMLHGVVFIAYCVVTCFVWVNQRWSFGRGVAGLASAIVPFCTVPFERSTERRGLLEGGWRLAPGGEAPRGRVEALQAWCLRRPLLAAAAGVVFVGAVTTVLLILGPPIPKG
jgi:integral membrane protein